MEKEITINGVTYVPKEPEKTEEKSADETMLRIDCTEVADGESYSAKVEFGGKTSCILEMWEGATKELFADMGIPLSMGAVMLTVAEIRDKHEKD